MEEGSQKLNLYRFKQEPLLSVGSWEIGRKQITATVENSMRPSSHKSNPRG